MLTAVLYRKFSYLKNIGYMNATESGKFKFGFNSILCHARERKTESGFPHGDLNLRIHSIISHENPPVHRMVLSMFNIAGSMSVNVPLLTCDFWSGEFSESFASSQN